MHDIAQSALTYRTANGPPLQTQRPAVGCRQRAPGGDATRQFNGPLSENRYVAAMLPPFYRHAKYYRINSLFKEYRIYLRLFLRVLEHERKHVREHTRCSATPEASV